MNLVLLTISHPDLDGKIRVVSGTKTIVSRGQEYIAYPFELVLANPDMHTDKVRARVRVDHLPISIARILKAAKCLPHVTVELVKEGTPWVVEAVLYDHPLEITASVDTRL